MARGKTSSKTIIVNNMPSVTTTRTVELIVKNDQLVEDKNDTEGGVNSLLIKN